MSDHDSSIMCADAARRFHEATKLSPDRPGRGGRRLDRSNRPAPFKLYRRLDPIALPRRWSEPPHAASEVLSVAPGRPPGGEGEAVVDLEAFARLLFLTAGVTRVVDRGGEKMLFRAAPSAGALYPVETYVACGDVDGLEDGLYHFEPVEFVLRRLRGGDVRAVLGATCASGPPASGGIDLVLSGIPWRTAWKYDLRGYRHLFWDAGTMIANALAAATAQGLSAEVQTGFVDDAVDHVIGVGPNGAQPFTEFTLAIVRIGGTGEGDGPGSGIATATDVRSELPPVTAEVAPLSREHVEIPGLAEVHDAGCLLGGAAVRSWRRAMAQVDAQEATTGVGTIPTTDASIDDVVVRRGSTRRFDPDHVAEPVIVEWGIPVARLPVRADALAEDRTLLRHLLAVHAVEGMEPGAYVATGDELARLGGTSRRSTAHLCLDQPLGGASALTSFLVADLDTLLEAGGARAYRVAQLEAGIAAERLQLAAFTAGLGGTGLTFYDDEIRRHFETRDEPMLATPIGRPAYEPRPGTRPHEQRPVEL